MAQIRIDIASEFKEKGFKQADKASTMLDKKFKALAKTFIAVFSVRQIVNFSRASVNAFAAAEKEAALLRSQLTGINLEFASDYIDEYIDKLELMTGRTGDELVPAFNTLSQATQDITKAQELLNLALDVSAGTGKNLTTVAGALQRAYKGETTAIAKLRLGLTTAELKGKKFAFVVEELEKRFGGASQRNAATFASSIDRIKRSAEQAQEAFGEGFVTGLEKSGKSVEDLQEDIIDLGEAAGEAAAAFTTLTINMTNDISKFLNSSGYLKFRDFVDFLFRQANFVITGEMLVPKTSTNAAAQRRAAEERNRAELRQRNEILKQEKKNAEMRKKIQTEEEKRRKLELARKRAQTIFDIENIQIVAALQGKIDGEQRTRLVTLLALNTENYTAAEKLADIVTRLNAPALANLGVFIQSGDTIDDVIKKLITSQAKLAGLQLMAEDFPELENPFEEWNMTLDEILAKLMAMMEMLMGGTSKKKIPSIERPIQPLTGPGSGASSNEWMRMMDQLAKVGAPYVNPTTGQFTDFVSKENAAAAAMNVTVNVSGNVTSERDLVTYITQSLYSQQKSGQQVVFNSTSI
jgi:hypothetical protein